MRLLAIYLMVIGACLPLQAQDLHSDLRTGELRRLALKGRASAQFELGIRYEYGHGVSESDAEAVRWYRAAAEQGFAPAQYNLGVAHEQGSGVPKLPIGFV